ncbi:MAG: hypothetical protein ACOCRX_06150 [Candidatus Woesearchaeota archaeon]
MAKKKSKKKVDKSSKNSSKRRKKINSGHLRVRRKREADFLKKYKKRIRKYKRFELCNGRQIKTVYDLVKALKDMDDDVFNHHVTDDRNDFYNWVNEVFFRDDKLAKLIKNSKTKTEMRENIISRIIELIEISF